jgi:hypothetical protein
MASIIRFRTRGGNYLGWPGHRAAERRAKASMRRRTGIRNDGAALAPTIAHSNLLSGGYYVQQLAA